MKFVAVVTRTLRAGKTFDDYRRAWFHSNGFGVPTQMYTVVNAFNPREIISIGIIDTEVEQLSGLLAIDVEDRLANPLDDVIETAIVRTFGVVAAVDDFSAAGPLEYVEPSVDGVASDLTELPNTLAAIATLVSQASDARDRAKPSGPVTGNRTSEAGIVAESVRGTLDEPATASGTAGVADAQAGAPAEPKASVLATNGGITRSLFM